MPNASLAGMLGVSEEKKAKMEERERERAALAKRKKEADAKERKRKREAEKARIAQYEEAAAQEAVVRAREPGCTIETRRQNVLGQPALLWIVQL